MVKNNLVKTKVDDVLNQKILDYIAENNTKTVTLAVEMILEEYFELVEAKSQAKPVEDLLSEKAKAVLDKFYNGLSPIEAIERILENYSDSAQQDNVDLSKLKPEAYRTFTEHQRSSGATKVQLLERLIANYEIPTYPTEVMVDYTPPVERIKQLDPLGPNAFGVRPIVVKVTAEPCEGTEIYDPTAPEYTEEEMLQLLKDRFG